VQISVVRPSELGPDEVAAWHSMQRKTRYLASPFLCPEFAVAVDNFRPDARVAVLLDGPTIVGFFPFERRRFSIGVPIGAGLSDCQGLIHAPGLEWDSRELLRACNISVWQFDHLVAGQRPFKRYAVTLVPSPVIDLTDGFLAYQEKLRIKSSKFCRQLASKARILERDAGKVRFIVDSRDSAGLRTLMRWKSDQLRRTGRNNIFDRSWIVDLVDYLFHAHNDRFGGQLSLMYAGETLISTQFDIRFNHVLAGWITAYNRSFSRQSPGLIHHLRKAEETAALGVHLIDLGKGTEPYKQKLKNHELFVAEGMASGGSLLAAVHRVRGDAVRWARPRIKRHPHLFRMFRAADCLLWRYGRIS
jgi:CelD/BcsL family acetyltransferase involved in cellulose biosynthesis